VSTFLTALENVDLTPLLLLVLAFAPSVTIAIGPPMLTLGGLVDMLIGSGADALRRELEVWLDAVDDAIDGAAAVLLGVIGQLLLSRKIAMWHGKIAALRAILRIVVRPARRMTAETALPSLAGVSFPNVYDAFFGPGAHPIGPALIALRDEVQTGVHDILGAGVGFLNDLGDAFSRAAAGASVLGSPEQYRLIGERASGLAESLFGPDAAELRRRIATRPPDVLARAFESWVARGGFDIIGAAIPLYVAEMRRFWDEEADRAATEAPAEEIVLPTSPHITARRAQLGRVFMPRLVIRAPGRALDDELVGVVAARFKEAVEGAFQTGQTRLAAATGG